MILDLTTVSKPVSFLNHLIKKCLNPLRRETDSFSYSICRIQSVVDMKLDPPKKIYITDQNPAMKTQQVVEADLFHVAPRGHRIENDMLEMTLKWRNTDVSSTLVTKWRFFCRFQLFHLPAKKNIETVLEDYANYKKSKGNSDNK